MAEDELQLETKEFDFVVLGTGLTECILSAALARSGKAVLHLDENQYYGGNSGSLQLDMLDGLLASLGSSSSTDSAPPSDFTWAETTTIKRSESSKSRSLADAVIENPASENNMVLNPALSRRCSIDLVPKVIWSRSVVIDALIRAGVSRYLEFKTVQHLYMHAEGGMVLVPVSKADVFNTTDITLIEKRLLMKFITTLSQPNEEDQSLLEQYADRPFGEYTKLKKLTPRLTDFLAYAIAMEPRHLTSPAENMTTSTAVHAVLRFMSSVGRYGGNSPWIYPLFGIGDLCQSFSRLSAVYGATFILGKHATELCTQKNAETGHVSITGINVGTTKDLKTKHVVSNLDHLPELARAIKPTDKSLSRCVLITDGPLKTRQNGKEIMLAVIPPNTFNNATSVYIIQLDESASVVPAGKYLIQMWTEGTGNGAQADLRPTVDAIARSSTSTSSSQETTTESQGLGASLPPISYAAYWSHFERSLRNDIPIPENLTIVEGITADVGADCFFTQAQSLFERICPGEEFIPVVPNPEDIIWGGDEEEQSQEATQESM